MSRKEKPYPNILLSKELTNHAAARGKRHMQNAFFFNKKAELLEYLYFIRLLIGGLTIFEWPINKSIIMTNDKYHHVILG